MQLTEEMKKSLFGGPFHFHADTLRAQMKKLNELSAKAMPGC